MITCFECKERPAVFFTQNEERKNIGLCLKCAVEKNVPHIQEFIKQHGIEIADLERMGISMSANPVCAYCRDKKPEIFSEAGNFGLCMDCAHLFYPQINTFEAKKYHTPIEECCVPLTAPDACKICGIRRAQIHAQEGSFCLVCAKKQKMPKADAIAARIGISPEQLEAFAQAVSLSDAQIQKPQSAEDSGRLKVIEQCTVNGKQVLFVADTKTGVQYLADVQMKHFSPVLDTDGKPLCIRSGEKS